MNLADDVTLLCVDTVNLPRAVAVLEHCKKSLPFKHVRLISSLSGDYPHLVHISPLMLSASDPLAVYSHFCIHELHKFFETSHCLIVQHDGYIVNPALWRDEWLEWDYIGCMTDWSEPGEGGKGGNGGFSLRSRKLMQLVSKKAGALCHPEDQILSAVAPLGIRSDLEAAGCRFAPASVQKIFGDETGNYLDTFGFHSKFHADLVWLKNWLKTKG